MAFLEFFENGWQLVYLVFFIAIAAFVVNSITLHRKLRHVPGPWLAGWSRLWMAGCTYRNTLHTDVAEACKKYGSLVRIAPDLLVTNDPDTIRRMSAVRSQYNKSDWYASTALSHERHHIFSETDAARHADLRSKMASGYSGKELGNAYLEECIDARMRDLFNLIETKYTSSGPTCRPIDLASVLQYFVIDTITDMAFREPFGFLKADDDVCGYIATQEMMFPIFEWFSTFPLLSRIVRIKWISKMAMPTPEDKTGLGVMLGIGKRTVAKRFGPDKVDHDDMLGSFIKRGLDQKQAEQEAVLQVFVGTDTTVTSMRTTVMYIVTHPHVYARLQGELDDRLTSLPRTACVPDAQARQLPYLQACIKEAMRVFPPVTGFMTKKTPPQGDTINGYALPGNTDIGYCAWDFYKNESVFGPDADVFRPERWLEASGETLEQMERHWDLVFGYGKYGCLGKPIAMMEMGKIIAEVFRRYEVSLVDPLNPWKSYNRNGFFFQSDMWVRMEERKETLGGNGTVH